MQEAEDFIFNLPKDEQVILKGNLLSNEQRLLISEGRKQVYTIKIYSLAEIHESTLLEILNEAISADEQFARKKSKS